MSGQPAHFVIRPNVDAMIQALKLLAFYESGGQMVVVIGSSHQLGPQIEKVVEYAKRQYSVKSFDNVMVDGESIFAMTLKR